MSRTVQIMVMRHGVFYAPLIGTIAGGFLEREGLEGHYRLRPPGRNPFEMLQSGEVQVAQAAVSSSWHRLERGERDLPLHFAQINRRDGFWILARKAEPFDWPQLEGRTLLADHGPQPLAMLRYAAESQGVVWDAIDKVDAGSPDSIADRFRDGQGDFAHLQGPMPQQLSIDGSGHVVAAVGRTLPPVAFSSLTASKAYLDTEEAAAFIRAFRRSMEWVLDAPVDEVVAGLSPFFAGFEPAAVRATLSAYRELGCWSKNIALDSALYDQALDVFASQGLITRRHPYHQVVVPPPS